VVLNKKEVSLRRKKIQIPEEEEEDDNYMDIDPLAIEEPIIPLPDDDIDPDYEPGHTDNERSDSDSDGTCNSIVIENHISMDECYESIAEDSDFEPRKTRSKKARAMSTRRTKRVHNDSDYEETVLKSSRKSRRKRRRVDYKDYYDSSSDEPSTPSDDIYEDESADISGADPTSPGAFRDSDGQDDVDAAILEAVGD
ncbi:7244_t:CDS:1, partial [Racocetra persica]